MKKLILCLALAFALLGGMMPAAYADGDNNGGGSATSGGDKP